VVAKENAMREKRLTGHDVEEDRVKWLEGMDSNDSIAGPEDPVDWFWCVEAIETGRTFIVSQYLRSAEIVNPKVIQALARTVGNHKSAGAHYVLKRRRGRPTGDVVRGSQADREPLNNPVDPNDIQLVVRRVCVDGLLDRRTLNWLADLFDPADANCARLVFVPARGRPRNRSWWRERSGEHNSSRLMLGLKLSLRMRAGTPLKRALHNCGNDFGCSEATVYRAYDLYRKHVTKKESSLSNDKQ
jgi:hypothetical protein